MTMMNAQEILDTLDDLCDQWPIINPLETHFRVGDARMTVFRSETNWVIFIEVVEYAVGHGEFQISLYAYGNCLRETTEDGRGLNQNLARFYRRPFEFIQDTTPIDAQTGAWRGYNRHYFSIWLRGKHLDFAPTAEEYAAAGIVFDADQAESERLEPEQLLRFLCHHLNHPFFSSEDYLRSVMDAFRLPPAEGVYEQAGLSHYMALFLQAGEWQDADDYLPSDVAGFQILARAIASGDLTEWNSQDPATFNTDWRPWEAERRAEELHLKALAEQQAANFSRLAPDVHKEMQELLQKMLETGAVGNFPLSWSIEVANEDAAIGDDQ